VRRALYWKRGKYIRPAEGESPFTFVTLKTTKSVREIDLSPELKRELRRLWDEGSVVRVSPAAVKTTPPRGLVFCTTEGKPFDPDGFQKRQFSQAVLAAQIGHLRFHDLRHTFGSLKLEQGANIYYVQEQMGHSSITVTVDVYAHQLKSRKLCGSGQDGCADLWEVTWFFKARRGNLPGSFILESL
jgi:integrase